MVSGTKAKKNKKKKSGKNKINGDPAKINGIKVEDEHDDEAEGEEAISRASTEPPTPTSPHNFKTDQSIPLSNGNIRNNDRKIEQSIDQSPPKENLVVSRRGSKAKRLNSIQSSSVEQIGESSDEGREIRFAALSKEREALRDEVAQVRKSLEDLQGRHEAEISDLREQLVGSQEEKETAEMQYQNLLGRVNTIKTQLGDRLKADAVRETTRPPFSISLT